LSIWLDQAGDLPAMGYQSPDVLWDQASEGTITPSHADATEQNHAV